MAKRSRANRFAIPINPNTLRELPLSRAAWHETPEEIEAGLEWGRQKEDLLKWVRRQMVSRLTRRERRTIELYFFHGLSYRKTAEASHVNKAAAFRTVQRALRKLRRALADQRKAADHAPSSRRTRRRARRRPRR